MLSAVTMTTPAGSTQSGAFTLPILAAASEPVSAAIWNIAAALARVTTPDRDGITCLVLDRRGPMGPGRIESGRHAIGLMQRAISREFTDCQIKIC